MRAPTEDDKRFLNFPLFMLAKTITDPERGINDITSFAIANYARHTQPEDAEAALIQAMYVASQRPSETLPDDVQKILDREDVDGVMEALPENFGGTGDASEFIAGCSEMIADANITLNEFEAATLVAWHSLRRSANYFDRTISSYSGIERVYARVSEEKAEHENRYGPTVWASVPAAFASEVGEKSRDFDLFRCVAACRSIIGRHKFTGTTKVCIRNRMIGAKSQRAADALLQDDAIRDEYERLKVRYQFDKTLTAIDRECRGFITKIGVARRIWLSTQATSHRELAGWINEHRRHKKNQLAEAEARRLLQ